MTSIVSFKNKLLESLLTAAQFPGLPNDPVVKSDILNQLERAPVYLYSMNGMVAFLTPSSPDEPLDTSFVDGNPFSSMMIAYWKSSNLQSDPTRSVENYTAYPIGFDIISVDPSRLEWRIRESEIRRIRDDFRSRGITKPDYGIFQFTLSYVGGHQITYAVKYTDLPIFTAVIPPVAPSSTLINYYLTPSYTFEALYVPTLSSSFTYNFYELNEEDFEAASSRNYSGFSTRDIPRYIKLNWTAAPNLATVPTDTRTRIGGVTISTDALGPSVDARIGTSLDSERVALTPGTLPAETDLGRFGVLPGHTIPTEIALGITETQYVGYVISKEKLNKETGEYELINFIIINNRTKTELIDWKVGYSESYRYKIRSVFQYVNRDRISIYEDSDSALTRNEQLSSFGIDNLNSYLYYFDSDYSINQDIDCIEFKRPETPSKIQIIPNSQNRKIFITWNQKNPNRDVKGFNVYRKDFSKNSYFRKLNQNLLDIRHNFFIDSSIEIDEEYIYAIESVDVHDNFSSLSIQLSTKIIPFDIDLGLNEETPQFFEFAGKEIIAPTLNSKNLNEYSYFKDKFKIFINPIFSEYESGKCFTIKILSLDTLQTKQIKLKFKLTTIYHRGLDLNLERDARPVESIIESDSGTELPSDLGVTIGRI